MTHFPSSFRAASGLAVALLVACAPGEGDLASSDDPTESTTQEITGAGRRVCSWNIHRLGNQFAQLPKDIEIAAKVIKDNCDVIAIQEVMETVSMGTAAFDELLEALGTRYWAGNMTEKAVPFPATSNSERYGFFWRKSSASLCEGWSGVKQLPDDEDVFIREPAWACFKLKASPRELVLGNYHALFGEMAARRREIGFIDDDLDRDGKKDDVFNALKASRAGNPDLVLVGDFNLTPPQLKEVLPRYADLTSGEGSTLNDQNEVTTNLYDHAVVLADSPLLAATKPAEVLDVRRLAKTGTFYSTVSDHLPIRFILK